MEKKEKKWERADVVKRKRAFVTALMITAFMLAMTISHLARVGTENLVIYVVPAILAAVITLVIWLNSEKVRKEYEGQIGKTEE